MLNQSELIYIKEEKYIETKMNSTFILSYLDNVILSLCTLDNRAFRNLFKSRCEFNMSDSFI